MSKLSVKVANNKPKRPQPTKVRHNVCCRNCKGQGHLANECPTPKRFRTNCIFYEGNHAIEKCCNLKQPKVVNHVDTNQTCPWQQERNEPGPNANYDPKSNFNRRPVPLNFQGHSIWNQQNGFSNWNRPPSYNQNYKRFDLNLDDSRKYYVCYRCKELGHYANNYPNPHKPQDYVALYGNCRTT